MPSILGSDARLSFSKQPKGFGGHIPTSFNGKGVSKSLKHLWRPHFRNVQIPQWSLRAHGKRLRFIKLPKGLDSFKILAGVNIVPLFCSWIPSTAETEREREKQRNILSKSSDFSVEPLWIYTATHLLQCFIDKERGPDISQREEFIFSRVRCNSKLLLNTNWRFGKCITQVFFQFLHFLCPVLLVVEERHAPFHEPEKIWLRLRE